MYSGYSLQETIDKYLEGSASEEERVLIEKWFDMAASDSQGAPASEEDKEKLFARLALMMEEEKAAKENVIQVDFNEKKRQDIFWRRWWVAASILLLTSTAIGYSIYRSKVINSNNGNIQLLSIVTKMGEVKKVILPDSSQVWLNANAKLSYKSDFLKNRKLELEGEALFEVTHDSLHPFSVSTPDGLRVKVLGTRFDLCSYSNTSNTKVSVIRGHVSFADKNKVLDTLSKGDVGSYNKSMGAFKKSTIEDISKVDGWITGQWQFDNMTIDDLTRLLYDHYGVQLIAKKAFLKRVAVNVNFTSDESSEEIVKVFSTLVQCKYRWENKTTIILY